MSKAVSAAILSLSMALAPALAAPAEAAHRDWSIGAGFRIGSAQFELVFGQHGRHRPDYYYRTRDHYAHRGYQCSDRCFRQNRYTYHHQSCPLTGRHFAAHHEYQAEYFDRYAPPPVWQGRSYESYGPRDSYRHDSYRYDDRRYDDRGSYGRHDRGRGRGHDRRGHRHDASCGQDWRHRPYR